MPFSVTAMSGARKVLKRMCRTSLRCEGRKSGFLASLRILRRYTTALDCMSLAQKLLALDVDLNAIFRHALAEKASSLSCSYTDLSPSRSFCMLNHACAVRILS